MDAVAELGPADVAAEKGPANAVAETETQLPPGCPAPSEPTPSAPSAGRVTAWQFSEAPSPPGESRRGPSAQLPPSQPAEPLPVMLGSTREVIGRLEAAVAEEIAQREAERAALATERAQLAAARAANEDERHTTQEGRKALEEARAEVARERKALEDTHTENSYPSL
ncbi:uncharacterized protein LOC133901485 [Phragmites australis]|uniref:uncharacterized protein LOC133901485 n=1 Tax=Phragmites australis TaxID=29695 RepID=UPI002D795C69|nr:uncharacterized protein LOC133901485 [Phragmites australis]